MKSNRRSTRLNDYDYSSAGAYFVTICVKDRKCLLGEVMGCNVGATRRVAPTTRPHGPKPGSIGAIIGQFKSITTKRINESRQAPGTPVWQRNYYEHIIRNESELFETRQYIQENPLKWDIDPENPQRILGVDQPAIV